MIELVSEATHFEIATWLTSHHTPLPSGDRVSSKGESFRIATWLLLPTGSHHVNNPEAHMLIVVVALQPLGMRLLTAPELPQAAAGTCSQRHMLLVMDIAFLSF